LRNAFSSTAPSRNGVIKGMMDPLIMVPSQFPAASAPPLARRDNTQTRWMEQANLPELASFPPIYAKIHADGI
jgi:hypothetical protein